MALKAAANPRRVLVIRKVKATLGDSIYRLTRSILAELAPETGLWMKENKSEMCLSLSNGSQFLFKGLDDPEKLKSIADITDVIIEEATELSLNDFTQIDIRLRPPKEVALPQIYLMFNPVSKANWCYAHWILKPPKEAVIPPDDLSGQPFFERRLPENSGTADGKQSGLLPHLLFGRICFFG